MSKDSDLEKIVTFYNSEAWNYSERYDRAKLMSVKKYPANYFRLQILISRIATLNHRKVYEVGTGEGTPLMSLADMGVDIYGCDIAEAMVNATREKLKNASLSADRCIVADIEDSVTFAPHLSVAPFDALVAFGVIPHVQKDQVALRNMRSFLRPGGRLYLEFRNKLFSLFTFNAHTRDFILQDLLAGVSEPVRKATEKELDWRCAESPKDSIAKKSGAEGYDAIRAKFHNPLELPSLLAEAGFKYETIYWYHYHPSMPRLAETLGDEFREQGFQLEHDTKDWRGYFLCSAGVVEAEAV